MVLNSCIYYLITFLPSSGACLLPSRRRWKVLTSNLRLGYIYSVLARREEKKKPNQPKKPKLKKPPLFFFPSFT